MKPNIENNNVEEDDETRVKCENGGGGGGGSCGSATKPYERKRTANLENLIGNLKVRKMNQDTTVGSSKSSSCSSSSGSSENAKSRNNHSNLTSLYVEVTSTANSTLSDCSRSTPPLSSTSPSVSPSSISPDSPPPALTNNRALGKTSMVTSSQSSISSLASSSSSQPNFMSALFHQHVNSSSQKSKSGLPLPLGANFNWMMDHNSAMAAMTAAALSQNNGEFVGEHLKELQLQAIKQASKLSVNNNPKQKQIQIQKTKPDCKPMTAVNSKQQTAGKNGVNNSCGSSTASSASSTSSSSSKVGKISHLDDHLSAPAGGPNRAVRFYDDYIDFRGDLLHRPPNSKACRILWEYLYLLLQDSNYSSVIKWEDESQMVFRIVQAEKLAALWGLQKNRLGMTYEKLSRGMRYYYPNNIIAREPGRRLLYRFMRHPDEIKKFVKKNGTYMLKKTKSSSKTPSNESLDDSFSTSKQGDEGNPDDSGVDEPKTSLAGAANTSSKSSMSVKTSVVKRVNNRSKPKSNEADEDEDEIIMGNEEEEDEDNLMMDDDADTMTAAASENIKNDEEGVDDDDVKSVANPQQQIMNNFYSELYPFMYSAQMAMFTRMMSNQTSNHSQPDDPTQLFMNLRNHQTNESDPNTNQYLNESLKSIASTLLQQQQQRNVAAALMNQMTSQHHPNSLLMNAPDNLMAPKRASSASSKSSSYSSIELSLKKEPATNGSDSVLSSSSSPSSNSSSSSISSSSIKNEVPLNLSNKNQQHAKKKRSKYDINRFAEGLTSSANQF